ncbi:hypothetical protein [Kineosporia succinea]|uniref:2-methylcitrate dehydratase PrpD n=1 Tax=Kineosporia succinea TaxID=84632 RepID=A0ABT9PAA7_9ACTN|nr:hypothetical protein [Kineosporia succinea]MDP9829125.1 2-methylcitrate dehydratase PrpD [Kineosporia succinea]
MNHRTIAALAAAGGAAHLLMLLPHLAWAPHVLLFGAMSLVCLACAAHLRRDPAALAGTAIMAATMIVAHLVHLFVTTSPFEATVTHHTVTATGHAHGASLTLLIPLIPELAVLALTGPVRRRSSVREGEPLPADADPALPAGRAVRAGPAVDGVR